jgi:glycosyltransferase involved in cell wall biosynthesis
MDSELGLAGAIKASIIIPTYNRKDNLVRILESLKDQTASPGDFEVIVVDDGSTDDSSAVAGLAFPFSLRYLRQANLGSAAARNAGAELASGDLLIFLDDDMIVEKGFISGLLRISQLSWLHRNGIAAAFCA